MPLRLGDAACKMFFQPKPLPVRWNPARSGHPTPRMQIQGSDEICLNRCRTWGLRAPREHDNLKSISSPWIVPCLCTLATCRRRASRSPPSVQFTPSSATRILGDGPRGARREWHKYEATICEERQGQSRGHDSDTTAHS